MVRLAWLWIVRGAGKLVNLAGLPGFVRECDYRGSATDAAIQVKRTDLYTVVTVNGLDVYFNRLTGTIDGTGTSQTSGYKADDTARLIDSGAPSA